MNKTKQKSLPRQQVIGKSVIKDLHLDEDVFLHPEVQHIPLEEHLKDLRPPPPQLSEKPTYFVGTSAFRDGYRCGKTLFTALSRASDPSRVRIGVVDQVLEGDIKCLDAYCERARQHWNISSTSSECPYQENIRVDVRNAMDSRGPIVARHYQQELLRDEEFCLQVDCHSIFTNNWDKFMTEDWFEIGNEMAVITTYPHNLHNFIAENGDNNRPSYIPYICGVKRGAHGLVRNKGATLISNAVAAQMTAFYGAGLVFSKCHAERRVPVDPNSLWIFDGEEFSRAALLWTAGYDMYSPTGKGLGLYHNYTAVPVRYFSLKTDPKKRKEDEQLGANRVRLHIGMEFNGSVSTWENKKYFQYYLSSRVRTLEQYYNFSGVHVNVQPFPDNNCKQLHWVPYRYPEDVEALVPGWKMIADSASKPMIHTASVAVAADCPDKPKSVSTSRPSWRVPWKMSEGIQFICLAMLFVVLTIRSLARVDRGSRR